MAQRAASGGAGGRGDGSGRPRREARLGRALGAGTTAPHAVVLVLPGGAAHSEKRTSPAATAVAVSLARRLARAAREETVVAHIVHYRYRGWNGEAAHPVQDAQWALDEVVRRYGDVSVCLAGMDIGARAALRAAGHPAVASVLAIAPRLPEPGTETSGHTDTDGEPGARADCSAAGTPQLERHTPPRSGSSGTTTWRSRLRGPLERRRGTTHPTSHGDGQPRSGTPAPSEPAGRREPAEPAEPVEPAAPTNSAEGPANSTGTPANSAGASAGSATSTVPPSVAEDPGERGKQAKPGTPGKPRPQEARTAPGTTPSERPEPTEPTDRTDGTGPTGPNGPPRHAPAGAPSAAATAPTPEPWESPPPPRSSEPVEQLVGRHVLFVHGTDDTTTDPELSYQLAERAKSLNDDVCRFEVHTDGHALLQHHSEVAALAGDFVLGTLCGQDFSRPVTDALAAPPPLGLRMPLASGFGRSLRG